MKDIKLQRIRKGRVYNVILGITPTVWNYVRYVDMILLIQIRFQWGKSVLRIVLITKFGSYILYSRSLEYKM